MTFNIDDDPIPPTDARGLISDWFMDTMPADVSEYRAAHEFALHLVGRFTDPNGAKTILTHRRHLLAQSKFLARLAELDGDLFDEVMRAYAERSLAFDQPHAA